MTNKSKENIEKLSAEIVEAWDMDMLIGFATDHVIEDFTKLTDEEFDEEWNNFYNPEV